MVNESGGASGATIIIGSLNDQELKNSIDALVKHVEQGTQKMANSFDSSIDRMKNKLKELGSVKVNVDSGSDGGSTRRVRTQKAEVQAINETVEARKRQIQTLDQEAAAMQRAMTPRTAQESYYTIIKNMRENVALLAMEIKSMPSMSLDKQFSAYMQFERQIEQVKARIGELRQQLQEVGKDPSGSRLVARQLMDGIAEEQRKIVQLEREQIRVTNQIAEEDRKVLANKQAQYEKERQALIELSAGQREQVTFAKQVTQEKQQQAQATQMQSQAEREAAREAKERAQMAKEMAQMARESLRNGMTAWRVPNSRLDSSFIYAENDARARGLSIEQQIDAVLKQEEADYQRIAQGVNQQLDGERQITQELSKRKKYQTPQALKDFEIQRGDIERIMRSKLGNSLQAVKWDEQTSSIKTLTAALKQYQNTYEAMTTIERKSPWGKQMVSDMEVLRRSIQSARREMVRASDRDAVRLLPTRTIDEITYKMQQLSMYRSGLDVDKQRQEINQVNAEYDKLKRKLDELMQKNSQMERSNNALSRSWNYMKNRLAFYFTVGASTQFVRNLIEVRSQYEMNERALGILINSAERGTQIFSELSRMALVSPYTLIELSSAAKQLVAYDVAANDVLDTTRRLADMAAAVGVPMERLTYALGQIKAYGYLNSRDNRMFANAGIPLVKQLSDYYTELEGKLVSTADVYDRIKKKAVGYNEVMQVIYKMTDEGGKFFDFQAKMADTLKVRLANLTLAWNNMLNEMGKETQGVLTGAIGMLRDLFKHWKGVDRAMRNIAITLGVVKGYQLAYWASVSGTNKAIALETVLGSKLTKVLKNVASSMKTLISSPTTWWSLLAIGITSAVMSLYDARQELAKFNKAVRDGSKDNFDNISKFLEQYEKVRKSLYKTEDKDGQKITTPQDIEKGEASKIWEAIREQIELTTNSSEKYIGKLLAIENLSERVRQGFDMLEDIKVVNAALKEVGDKTFKVTQNFSAWWNLNIAPDGLINNIKEYNSSLNGAVESTMRFKTSSSSIAPVFSETAKASDIADQNLRVLQKDVDELTVSIDKFIKNKGWSSDANKIGAVFDQVSSKIALEGQLTPEEAFRFQLLIEEKRSEATKQALITRIQDENAALAIARDENMKADIKARLGALQQELKDFDKFNGEGRVHWNEFTKWMSEQHKSEVNAMFGNMTDEEIKSLQQQTAVFNPWVEKMVEKYAKEHKMSYDDAFNYLRNWIYDANQWTVFIKTTIGTEDGKSIYETLSEADTNLEAAQKKIDRLTRRKGELESMGANLEFKKYTKEGREYVQVVDEIASAEKDRATALAAGGHNTKQEKKDAAAARKAQKEAESELQKALKDELQLIDKVRSQYKKLTDAGVTSGDALTMVTNQFGNSISHINKILGKNGLPLFNIKTFAGTDDPNKILAMLKAQLEAAKLAKNIKPAEIKDLEVKYGEIVIDAKTYNTKKITDGLNNELSKIKDEYELAVELDANPELGDMFAQAFGIDTDALPRSFGEAFGKATEVVEKNMMALNADLKDFDLMSSVIKPDNRNQWMGLDFNSDVVKELMKWQTTFRDMFKKNITDTEKMMDDYVKKYGDYSDKIAEIEADRLEKLRLLNEAYYTEEMRKRPEYLAKLNAIEQGAQREKGQAKFDEFKNSRLYVAMFENLEYASSATLKSIRSKLEELKSEMGSLSPEQLKQVTQQFEKIDQELIHRNPFKGLIKNVKDYAKAIGTQGKKAQEDFIVAQRKYDTQEKVVAQLKEELEQRKHIDPLNQEGLETILKTLGIEEEKLKKLKEELQIADNLNAKYDVMRMIFKTQSNEIAQLFQTIATNLQSLGELRDTLNEMFGVELGNNLDAVIDDLNKVGSGISKVVSSAQGGDFVGAATGVIQTVAGIGDTIASIFGDGAARTRRINREINASRESVRQLNMAYKDLERAVEKSLGSAETAARRSAIANKEAELAELERQLVLEQSKRKKDRDDESIKQIQETIQDLRGEIEDLKDDLVNNLLGSDVKNAAEGFVDAWVEAWRSGETTLDAIETKMDEMMLNLVKKAATSKIVASLLQPLYDSVDKYTSESSMGGVDLTTSELQALATLSGELGVKINNALGAFYGNLANLGIISQNIEDGESELSALQAGIQGITEDTAGALEAYMNGVSQQVYLQSDLLMQIRDTLVGFDLDVNVATLGQVLLQLQASYQTQQAIQGILEGWSSASGLAVKVEMVS